LQKTRSEAAEVTCCGRAFHRRRPATGKDRSPTVERRVLRRTIRYVDEAQRALSGLEIDAARQ